MRRLRESNSRLMVELKQLREAKMRQAQLVVGQSHCGEHHRDESQD